MKRSLFLVFAAILIFTSLTISQAIIDPDEIPSEPGTVMSFYTASDIEGIEVEVGAAGANRNWDFTEYIFDEMEYDSLIDPEEAPEIEDYPDANRVLRTAEPIIGLDLGEVHQYEVVSDSGWFLIGSVRANDGEGPNFGIPWDFTENPLTITPMPMEYGEEWDLTTGFSYALEANEDWGEEFALLDSIIFTIEIGGFSEIDAWGTVRYTGGEVEALRQHTLSAGLFSIVGVREILGRQIEIPLFEYEMQASHKYRWFAPEIGEIATFTSLALEENPEFELARKVRVRCLAPALEVAGDSLAFGIVQVGNAGVATLTISNDGEGSGIIERMELSETLIEELEALVEFPLSIDPDSEAEIRFLWMPQEERNLDGEIIELYHNDPELDNPIEVTLTGGTPSAVDERDLVPADFFLAEVYPNPFNAVATITYHLPTPSLVLISVFNQSGRVVTTIFKGHRKAGVYNTTLNADDLPTGLYFIRLDASRQVLSRKVLLMR